MGYDSLACNTPLLTQIPAHQEKSIFKYTSHMYTLLPTPPYPSTALSLSLSLMFICVHICVHFTAQTPRPFSFSLIQQVVQMQYLFMMPQVYA